MAARRWRNRVFGPKPLPLREFEKCLASQRWLGRRPFASTPPLGAAAGLSKPEARADQPVA